MAQKPPMRERSRSSQSPPKKEEEDDHHHAELGMPATCWPLVEMSLIFDRHACRRRHKNDPDTRFLCQGLPTQPYTTHNHNRVAPLLCHSHATHTHPATAAANTLQQQWQDEQAAGEQWGSSWRIAAAAAAAAVFDCCCCLDTITLNLTLSPSPLPLPPPCHPSALAITVTLAHAVATGWCRAAAVPSPWCPRLPSPKSAIA